MRIDELPRSDRIEDRRADACGRNWHRYADYPRADRLGARHQSALSRWWGGNSEPDVAVATAGLFRDHGQGRTTRPDEGVRVRRAWQRPSCRRIALPGCGPTIHNRNGSSLIPVTWRQGCRQRPPLATIGCNGGPRAISCPMLSRTDRRSSACAGSSPGSSQERSRPAIRSMPRNFEREIG